LISGDQVLPKITTNVSVWPEEPHANPLRLYLDSLERFRPMPPETLVLPSHGLPFRGLHARLGSLRDHHDARLAEALDALVEPLSAADLVPTLFRRELDDHQLVFALGESLAHLRPLEADCRAHGVEVSGERLMAYIARAGVARPPMVRAIRRIRERGLRVGALTNNWATEQPQPPSPLRELFDVFVESRAVGMRKPDP